MALGLAVRFSFCFGLFSLGIQGVSGHQHTSRADLVSIVRFVVTDNLHHLVDDLPLELRTNRPPTPHGSLIEHHVGSCWRFFPLTPIFGDDLTHTLYPFVTLNR